MKKVRQLKVYFVRTVNKKIKESISLVQDNTIAANSLKEARYKIRKLYPKRKIKMLKRSLLDGEIIV